MFFLTVSVQGVRESGIWCRMLSKIGPGPGPGPGPGLGLVSIFVFWKKEVIFYLLSKVEVEVGRLGVGKLGVGRSKVAYFSC